MYVALSRRLQAMVSVAMVPSIVTTATPKVLLQRTQLSEMVPNTTDTEPQFRDTTSCVSKMVLK